MNLTRLWEVITGTPHKHQNAQMVNEAAQRLSAKADEFSDIMKPYRESEDPLVMLLTDAIIQRGFAAEGTGNEKLKLHP